MSGPKERFSLHDNSVLHVSFHPDRAQLHVIMEEPIVGAEGKRTLVFDGVRRLSVAGSKANGECGFLPGDEVLSVVTEQEEGSGVVLWKVRFLLSPIPSAVRPDTGLSVIEVVAERFGFAT